MVCIDFQVFVGECNLIFYVIMLSCQLCSMHPENGIICEAMEQNIGEGCKAVTVTSRTDTF